MKLQTFLTDLQKFNGLIKLTLLTVIIVLFSGCSIFKKDEKQKQCLYQGAVQKDGAEIYLPEKCELCTCQTGSWSCGAVECKEEKSEADSETAS